MSATHPIRGQERFIERLRGIAAREPFRFPAASIPPHFGDAAVLLVFWLDEDVRLRVLLTRRSQGVSTHKGQVSFPGGRLHEGESFEAAALRETHEEVGIEPGQVEILGRLDDAWSGAGHFLVPFVGWLDSVPQLEACDREVAELLTPRVAGLLEAESQGQNVVVHDGIEYVNSELHWEGASVVGLSADLLLETFEWSLGEESFRGVQRLADLHSFVWKGEGPDT